MKLISRFLARLFDYSLTFSIAYLIGAKIDVLNTKVLILLLAPLVPLFWVPFEALFTKLFNTTPGKALFGLRVKTNHNFKRALRIWAQVMGCGLPPLCFICPFVALLQRKRKEFSFDTDITSTQKGLHRFIIGSIITLSFITSPIAWDHFHRGSATPIHLDPALYKSWTTFDAPDKSFSAQFPDKTETTEDQLPIPDDVKFLPLTEHKTKHEHGEFCIAYTTLPKKWLKYSDKLIIKHSLLHMAESMGDLETRNYCMHGAIPAIDYKIKADGKSVVGRMLLVGDRLYKIELTTDSMTEEAQTQLELFINAFQIGR